MAGLSATFRLIDEMSDKLDAIASSGERMVSQLEGGGTRVGESLGSAISSADGYAQSISQATEQTDHWTEAAANYNSAALDAIYSTEELVDMGLKSAEALEEQEAMFRLCEQSASNLSSALSTTESIQNDLSSSMDLASETAQKLADNDNVSAEAKEQLAQASSTAAEAMENLTAAQREAEAAMAAYNEIISSGTTNLDELEAAAQRAGTAAENLAQANGTAKSATEQLGKATEEAGKQAEDAGGKGTEAIESISSALASAAIVATLKEAAQYAYELANSFSEAEKTISSATGAVGAELAALEDSAYDVYASNDDGLDRVAQLTSTVSVRFKETGDDLTDLTNRFLAFDDVCDTDVNAAVTNVTQTLNRWNMETDQADELMDKLTYAYQQTGASISGMMGTLVSGATYFQEMDMTLDGTITLLSEMEQQGINSTQVVTAMRTALTNFSADGLDAGTALRDVVDQIKNMEDSSEATTLAVETFGSRTGAVFADAIRNGTISVDTFTASMDDADGALDKMADTTETLDEKWQRAANNINSAFTKAVEPAVTKMSTECPIL